MPQKDVSRPEPVVRKGNRDKRILYVLTRFPVSTETFILNELRQMLRQGISYDLFAFHVDWKMAERPPYSEVPVRELPRPQSLLVLQALGFFLKRNPAVVIRILRGKYSKRLHHAFQSLYLSKWCLKNQIGHIHAHYAYHSTSAARIASTLTGISYSFTAHANDIFKSNWQMREKIRDCLFCATCTGYNKKYLQRTYATDFAYKIKKVYHGIDFTLFSPPRRTTSEKRSEFHIVTVARLREKKGLVYLIEACAQLTQQKLPVKITIVGDGPERQRLESLVNKLKLQERIQFTGSIPHEQVKGLLEDSDVFVLPCIVAQDGSRDGIPNVILEAMAMELPVISTTVSAIPEAVEHEKTGLLVSPKDPTGLARAIARMHHNPMERMRFGKQGRIRVEKLFDLDKNTRILVDLFQQALSRDKVKSNQQGFLS